MHVQRSTTHFKRSEVTYETKMKCCIVNYVDNRDDDDDIFCMSLRTSVHFMFDFWIINDNKPFDKRYTLSLPLEFYIEHDSMWSTICDHYAKICHKIF